MRLKSALALIGLLVLAVPPQPHRLSVLCAEERDSLAEQFRRYDSDGDQKVTPKELRSTRAFKRLDANGDGEITLAETRRGVARGALRGVELPPPVPPPDKAVKAVKARDAADSKQASPAELDVVVDRSDANAEIRQGPRPIKASDVGVGRRVPNLSFTDIDGNEYQLSDFAESKVVVLAMTGTGCPLCKKYAPSLSAIEDRYSNRGVQFIFVNPNESEGITRVRTAVEQHGFDGPYVRDLKEELTGALNVETTTEVFVIDSARTLCYRGAVDDQYGFGFTLDSPNSNYLADAIDAVMAGKRPPVMATWSPGCEMYYSNEPKLDTVANEAITYHNRVSRILQNHCVDCHREGGSGPFELQSYESARDYSQMIRSVVQRGVMPPWFAAKIDEAEDLLPIEFENDCSLSTNDRRDLLAWIKGGAVEGNQADAPLPRSYPGEWEIGEPDLKLHIENPIAVKATGQMPYKHAMVETELAEDRWVTAVEIRPTDPSVVHHVLVFVKPPGSRSDHLDEEAGFFAAYVPGNTFQQYPKGFAKKLPAGSKLAFQLHYTPNGVATSDQTGIGIRFADGPPARMIRNTGIANHRIRIPPGASNHREEASQGVPADVRLLSFMPHMHLRGKAFRYEVVFPDKSRRTLLDVPRYDFNWQLEYRLSQPIDIPRGSRIELTGWYDNSSQNPANPDHDKTVRWGPQTDDEMMLGYVEYIIADEDLP